MKPFRERNPVPIGIISLIATVGALALAFDVQNLPFFRGTLYKADFADSGDLTTTNEVRIAGVRVGDVRKIELQGDHVQVTFSVKGDGIALGTKTRAVIKLKTVVGARYLELDPEGPGTMNPDTPIPVSRTESPFSIASAFDGLANNVDAIDVKQLAQSFDVLSSAFSNTPKLNQQTLEGLSRLSHTVASRNAMLGQLLQNTQKVVGTLNARDADLTALISNADSLLKAVQQRRTVIDQLLVNTSGLAQQLTGLARDNNVTLNSALGHVNAVLKVLDADRTQLDQTIQLLAPYSRLFANTLGNGRWFDVVLYNLLPNVSPTGVLGSAVCASVNGVAPNPLCDVLGTSTAKKATPATGGTK